ncbi:MAG: glycoside hydrolase family 99-like domain-containing protein [Burkholderiales bacterium]|nr:glycoside hydrolase family 99-like domain-containing protein [Bacteroidia bacterium]
MSSIRTIAIYLPQFHPFAQNDEWWGKGFTEWTNVTKAKPFFKNHYQPQLPTDLGLYDLRVDQTRIDQAAMAKAYGIYGFCYYHYWFSGTRLMKEPIDAMLKNKQPDFPFMFCWANETWSRRWLGEEKEILIKQEYGEGDDYAHATWLYENAFNDSRYITIYNRPAFTIYRPHDLPNYKKTMAIFKEVALEKGMPAPFFIGSNSHTDDLEGFDQILNFEPQLGLLPDAFNDGSSFRKLIRNLYRNVWSAKLKIYDYEKVKTVMAARRFLYTYLPCVFVGWDNTARRGWKGIIITDQNKEVFKKSLQLAKQLVENNDLEEQIVFINAWNEWAEGNHLESCVRFGHQFLEAVKEVFPNDPT